MLIVVLLLIMCPILLNDDSTMGPWKMERAARTTWFSPGYLRVSITFAHQFTMLAPSTYRGRVESTLNFNTSSGRSYWGGTKWPIIPASRLRRMPVSEWPLTNGSRADSDCRVLLFSCSFFCMLAAVDVYAVFTVSRNCSTLWKTLSK